MENFFKIIEDLKIRLEFFKEIFEKILKDYLYYFCYVWDLKIYKIVFEINIKNYEICLEKIKKISEIFLYW